MQTSVVRAAVDRLNGVLAAVDDAVVRAPSGLPGWSRGHVMAHIANFSVGMTRQVTEGIAGRLVEMYDGGRPARDAAIEADAQKSAAELTERVAVTTSGLLEAWDQVDDWTRRVWHRDGTLADTVYTGWREVEIHMVDLNLKPTSDEWSEEFCLHLLEFLRPRTPAGIKLVLDAGTTRWEEGTGQERVIDGRLTDLAAWMAGRQPRGPLKGDLPDLAPWP